jgi:hypothetical protein
MVSVNGMKYFVAFIDCYYRMTWVHLMCHTDKLFYAYVKNRFQVQVIRTNNGIWSI